MRAGRRLFSQDYSYQSVRNRLKALKIVEHLKSVHSIDVPDTFFEQILSVHFENYQCALSINLKTIDTIVDACELFEEYVLDFNQLVCAEVLSMVQVHACVISKNYFLKQLIPMKANFPDAFQAIVRKDGSVSITASYS